MICVCFLLVGVVQTLAATSNSSWEGNTRHFSSSSQARSGETSLCDITAVNGFSACRFGYYCTNGTCRCRKAPNGIVYCHEDGLNNIAVLNCYSATFDSRKNLMQVGAYVGKHLIW